MNVGRWGRRVLYRRVKFLMLGFVGMGMRRMPAKFIWSDFLPLLLFRCGVTPFLRSGLFLASELLEAFRKNPFWAIILRAPV